MNIWFTEQSDNGDESKHVNGMWSGQDVIGSMNKEKAMAIIEQLNRIRVYKLGWEGKLKRIRRIAKTIARNVIFENFMTLCVIVNTIALTIDRYNISTH